MIFSESLKRTTDFRAVYNENVKYVNKYLVLYVRRNGLEINRLGISVSKKIGNSVVRHRITRLIRESYRLRETDFRRGFDLVVVARGDSKEKRQGDIESALLHLAGLHGIIKNYEKNSDCTH